MSFNKTLYGKDMIRLGYALSSEEHTPQKLIEHAVQAEKTGFEYALISDHFHPWIDQQGQSSFVWAVIGGISQRTKSLTLGTGVTCPTIRIHPAIIAQAAATAGALMEGRFFLGLGTGENLNEHIVGAGWPTIKERQCMLSEAVEVIRTLWEGSNKTYFGEYYTVEDARIYTLPKHLPPIYLAASGPKSAMLAGKISDGFISTSPQQELTQAFEDAGGAGKPKYGQMTVCVADTEEQGIETALKWWPNSALSGQLSQELRLPSYFEQASKLVTKDHIAKQYVVGKDPKKHLQQLQQYVDAGFDHIYVHQIGPDQQSFFEFYQQEIFPRIGSLKKSKKSQRSKEENSRQVRVAL